MNFIVLWKKLLTKLYSRHQVWKKARSTPRGFFIIGTWTSWNEPEAMEDPGELFFFFFCELFNDQINWIGCVYFFSWVVQVSNPVQQCWKRQKRLVFGKPVRTSTSNWSFDIQFPVHSRMKVMVAMATLWSWENNDGSVSKSATSGSWNWWVSDLQEQFQLLVDNNYAKAIQLFLDLTIIIYITFFLYVFFAGNGTELMLGNRTPEMSRIDKPRESSWEEWKWTNWSRNKNFILQ